jgi:tRNA nucleotidyltransferase (CCA-adding enzyme)
MASAAWAEADPARRRVLGFAVLAHDFGKPGTTVRVEKAGQPRWVSPRHAHEGIVPTEKFLERIHAPHAIAPAVTPLVKYHLAHHFNEGALPSDSQLRRLARKLTPATLADLCQVMLADARGRPPREDPDLIRMIEHIDERASELALHEQAPRPIVQGRHLIARGLSPGPAFKPILDAAYEAQLDGVFFDEAGSSSWLDSHLRSAPFSSK